MLTGRIGQVVGPFTQNIDLLSAEGPIGALTPETTKPVLLKLGIQAEEGTVFKINEMTIKMGKTGIYELDNIVAVEKLIFISETTDTTIVDFVY